VTRAVNRINSTVIFFILMYIRISDIQI
jgi:hypothetical protein